MSSSALALDLIEIGCSVYAHRVDVTDTPDTRSIRGGVVVAIASGVNRTTGEIERKFITATPWRREVLFEEVLASEVAQVEPPSVASMRNLIRQAAGVVAAAKRVGSSEARCIQLQHDLMEAL